MPTTSGEDPSPSPHGDQPLQEPCDPNSPADQAPANKDDGFIVVGSGNLQRRVKISHNMVQAPIPSLPAQSAPPVYEGTAPPPLPEIYHGRGAKVEHVIDGKAVYYFK